MKPYRQLLYLLLLLPFLAACINEEEYADTPNGNFEALWRIIDEHYCFFDYKKNAYGLDWNEVYQRYRPQFNGAMTTTQQFEVLSNMLSELRDGHVNLYTSFDISRNWSWHENYPANYNDSLIRRYLGTDYRIATGMQYRILDDNIGYLRCPSFANGIGAGNLDDIFYYLAPCRGLIIDLRNNSGGLLTSAEELAARFTNKEIPVGYIQHKTGPGHNDFSEMKEQRLKPGKGIRWQKQVVILTIIGDRTGGGAGLPFSSELPCGWSVRFSACPIYDVKKQSTEFGIAPDYNVSLSDSDVADNRDTIIEYARLFLGNSLEYEKEK